MYDAKGDISNCVYYTLEKLDDGIYEINVVADAQWINSKARTLPITIDPLVESSKVVWDTYVSTSSKDSNFGTDTTVLVGAQYTALFKSNMPTLPNGATIQSATWHGALYYMDGVNLKTIIEARAMEGSWNEYSDTYNTLYANYGADLGISSTVLDTKTIISNNAYTSDNPHWISFDVTDAVQSWYNGTSNYGIAICHNHTYLYGGSNYYTVFVSWDAKTTYTSYYKIKYCESRIPDGVYRLKNYNGLYLTVDGDGVESGANLIQATDSTSGGSSEPTYNQLFKISYLGTYGIDGSNYYSVRPMTNCGLGMYASTSAASNPIATTMTNPNSSYSQTWIISVTGNYYTIRNGYASNFGYYLTAPSNTTNNASIITTKFELNSSPSNTSKWTLDRYVCDIEEVGIVNIASGIRVGDSVSYNGYMRSSQTGVNGPVIYYVTNDDFTSTDIATIDSNTGTLTTLGEGKIKIGLSYDNAPWVWWWNIEIVTSNGWYEVESPTIKSRSDWNARNVITSRLVPRTRSPQRIIFHHSADKFSDTDESKVIAEIQRIQNLHIDSKNKCDIAYHFIIDPAGRIWQGAQIDDFQRGHADGYFDDIGVLVLGDFEPRIANLFQADELNQNQKDAMEELSKWLCYKYNLPNIASGTNAAPISTHCTVVDTQCPGDNMKEWVENNLRSIINTWNVKESTQ